MTPISKRSFVRAAGWTALAAAAALAGCGKKEEAPAAAPPAPSAPAAAASVAAAKPEPLKVAFIYIGPVGDGGWTFAHDNGRKAVEKEFGDKVATTFVEKVPESADAERVFRDVSSSRARARRSASSSSSTSRGPTACSRAARSTSCVKRWAATWRPRRR
jgi:basic membrane protein A